MNEHQALEHVQSRLVERFPAVPVETVRRTVQDAHARFNGPVRDFVPILVEGEAKNRLATLVSQAPQRAQAET